MIKSAPPGQGAWMRKRKDDEFKITSAFFLKKNIYVSLIYFSLLIPAFGVIGSFILWIFKCHKSKLVVKHSKIVLNFALSFIFYYILQALLFLFAVLSIFPPFIFITTLLLIMLWVYYYIFAITGGVKAYKGQVINPRFYIKFFKDKTPN